MREQKEQARARARSEQERIEQELQTARSIQRAFLPGEAPSLPGWQFAPYYRPAREVGGDFYDFLPCADGRLGLVIGDVTGKGIPAALLMATVHTMLRAATQEMTAPSGVLARVNALLAAEVPAGMFVTCFFALLDPRHEMFGFPRLQRLLAEQPNGAPLIDVLLSELKGFTGEEWEQEDDVTLLALQRASEPYASRG